MLPLGMVFPYDFGFVPNSKGQDGDPLDAMVISEFPFLTGARIECRLIGGLLAEQRDDGTVIRNDRFFFIPVDSVSYDHIKNMEDFKEVHNDQLAQFFANYNRAEKRFFTPLQWLNAKEARKFMDKSPNKK
jgi:inorganic pyrophosphatase